MAKTARKRETAASVCLYHRLLLRLKDEITLHEKSCSLMIPIPEKDIPLFDALIQPDCVLPQY